MDKKKTKITWKRVLAVCLAVTASLAAREQCETIPPLPEQDEKGLYMMLTVPKKNPVRT